MTEPLLSRMEDRRRVAGWIDNELSRWQSVRNGHGGDSVKVVAGHYIDALLTVRAVMVGRLKARKRTP